MTFVYLSTGWFVAGIAVMLLVLTHRRRTLDRAKLSTELAALQKKNASLEEHFSLINEKLRTTPPATRVVAGEAGTVHTSTAPLPGPQPFVPPSSEPGDIKVFTEVKNKTTGTVMTVLGFKGGKAECFWRTPEGGMKQEYYDKAELENV